jgi:lipopolysaccharide/colanic/teichoic acid biosynthesis glycosyltransferase
LSKINDIKKINKFFEAVSVKMEMDGIFICCAVTNESRKKLLLKKYPCIINWFSYIIYFIYKRIWPKLPVLKKIYFKLTKGSDRAISHAEVLGRLYSCGFVYLDHVTINHTTWYAVKKTSHPILDLNPSYGPIIRLKRIGKNGKEIRVYKIRTMHPFSEYIQEFVYKNNNIENGGKFKDDYRVSTVGKVFRKIWLDEIPMIINVLKGELKIVGVRPLSKHYLSLYPEDFQRFRMQFKPGLFPPYYVDMPKSFEEIIESERKYLILYSKHKFLTDFRYFFIIVFNIIFKRARST